jgi:hypothetical protein
MGRTSVFGIYDKDDIYQEIFLMVRDAQTKYDESKSDDEFLFYLNYCRKRLKTLKRNNNVNTKTKLHGQKMKIINATQIDAESDFFADSFNFKKIDDADFLSEVVDKKIPASLRLNYLRLKQGAEINYHEKIKLIQAIRDIIRINNDKQETSEKG